MLFRSSEWGHILNRATAFASQPNNYNNVFSDASLLVIDSNNVPVVKLNFEDLFPISIEGLDFDITSDGMNYFVGVATFRYKIFTIQKLK